MLAIPPMCMGVGADAGDEGWACGTCAIYAVNNFLSNYLNYVHGQPYLDLDAATATAIMRARAGQDADRMGLSVEDYVELLNNYFREGKTFPLGRGGCISFCLSILGGARQGCELDRAQCGNVVCAQMRPAAWEDHYGKVDGNPALADDKGRCHCMVFESIDDDGNVTCYNSWKGQKHVKVPSDVFEYVHTYYVLQVSDIQFSPLSFDELEIFAQDRGCRNAQTRHPRRHPSGDAEYGRYKAWCVQQGLDNHAYVVKYTPWAGLPYCLTPCMITYHVEPGISHWILWHDPTMIAGDTDLSAIDELRTVHHLLSDDIVPRPDEVLVYQVS